MRLTSWGNAQAEFLLRPLGNRWLHVQQVAEQAGRIVRAVPQTDRDLLVAAGYLHDIGYAPQLAVTGFHPLDGARWIRSQGMPERLARLVAHHSCAIYEAQVRGLDKTLLAEFEPEQSDTYDALVFCDMTVGPSGELVSFDERIAEIFSRYGPMHEVTRAIDISLTALAACHRRTLIRLEECAD
jgi:putative nucleotidyltransferase with HDIG domain